MTNEQGFGSHTYQLVIEKMKVIKESNGPIYAEDLETALHPYTQQSSSTTPSSSPLKRKASTDIVLSAPKKRAFPDLVSPRKRVAASASSASTSTAARAGARTTRSSALKGKGKAKAKAEEEEELLDYESETMDSSD